MPTAGRRRVGRWRRAITPAWLPLAMAAMLGTLGSLTALLEGNHGKGAAGGSPIAADLLMIGAGLAPWVPELLGLRWPRLLFVVLATAPVAWQISNGSDLTSPLFLVLIVGWVTYDGRRWESIVALLLAIASLRPGDTRLWQEGEPFWVPWLLGVLLIWLLATALATLQRLIVELRAAQADLATQAAAEERRRIAREVHDVIAHTLAVTMLHLTGARHILKRDPERASEALAEAERLGRQSLADIRRTVGLLQTERPQEALTPASGAGEISALVAGYARAGLEVRFTLEGDPLRLSSAAGLGLYRIAQEALTNVAKHAPGAKATVELRIGEAEATLRIVDSGPAPAPSSPRSLAEGENTSSGMGVMGMRERAALLGGSLTAGRLGAGWQVECTIPLESAAPRETGADVLAEQPR